MARYRRALVYGGYGATGREIAALLAGELGLDIVVAGRDGRAGAETAAALAARLPQRGFSSLAFDIADRNALARALAGIDLIVVAAPVAERMGEIGRVALETGTDLIDILVRDLAAELLMPLSGPARDAGRAFVTGAGFHPGLPGAMMRALASHFLKVEAVHVGMAMRAPFRNAHSVDEIIPEIAAGESRVLDHGAWREAGSRDMRRFAFSAKFGAQMCYPLGLREIEVVGRALGLNEAGVYVAGFNWFIDWLVFPAIYLAHRIGGTKLAYGLAPALYWGNRWFSSKDYGLEIRAEATGTIAGRPGQKVLSLRSNDAVGFTAQCVIAAVRQMIDGPLGTPGVALMGESIDPERLFTDLDAAGAQIRLE